MGECEALATQAWTRMGARGENQSIIFLGESGAGKTTLRAHTLSALLNYSSTPLSTKISLASFVFDTLTSTKSITTPVASKAGLFLELQYDGSSSSNPTLVGGKLLDHRLERSRIASVPTGERSFHILYYLLAGTSPAEKQHLGLDTPGIITESGAANKRASAIVGAKRWRYLGHVSQLKVGINDGEGFQHFKTALRKLEFPRTDIAEVCQILACILHIGQLEFISDQDTTPAAAESGGYSHEGGEEVTVVRNREVLEIIAAFLGLSVDELETSLRYKTKTIHRERVTVMLDPKGARENADELARTLYSLLVAFIVERMNQRLCAGEDAIANTISMVDFPGFAPSASTGSALDQLLNNAANESLYNICLQNFFERKVDMLESEEVSVAATSYFDNSDAVKGLLKPGNGLLSILDDQTRRHKSDDQFLESARKRFEGKNPAISVESSEIIKPGHNFKTRNTAATFTVRHFAGEVDYAADGLMEANGEIISGDMMNLIRGTRSEFVQALFGQEALNTVMHPQEKTAVMSAQVSSKPLRMPSMARRKGQRPDLANKNRDRKGANVLNVGDDSDVPRTRAGTDEKKDGKASDAAASGQFLASLQNIKQSVTAPATNNYFVFCLKPNDRRIANQFDSKCVRTQVQTFGIAEISQRLRTADFSIFLPFGEFLGLTGGEHILVGSEREKAEAVLHEKQWPGNEARIGTTGIFLSERCWANIAEPLTGEGSGLHAGIPRAGNDEGMLMAGMHGHDGSPGAGAYIYGDESKGGFLQHSQEVDAMSEAGKSGLHGDMFHNFETREQMAERSNEKKLDEVDEVVTSGSRKRWMFIVWVLTFWCPDIFVKWFGRIKRPDVRVAWREKLAINMIIWLSCLFVVFFVAIFPTLICPTQDVFRGGELSDANGKNGAKSLVAIRGIVYDLAAFAPRHYPASNIIPLKSITNYAGTDATTLFPVQVSQMCLGKDGQALNNEISLQCTGTNVTGLAQVLSKNDPNAQYHDFRYQSTDPQPEWFYEQTKMMKASYYKGRVGYTLGDISQLANSQNRIIAMINKRMYDLTDYTNGCSRCTTPTGPGTCDGDTSQANFLDPEVVELFRQKSGGDITQDWNALKFTASQKNNIMGCMNNLFYVGDEDTRNSAQCQFGQYLILAISIMLASVIGFKFLAALQFGKKNAPENLDKFVICQVPAYTEDEDSLRRAIDSFAQMKYDDKRKLLIIICDGMIIGQGNDRPTPRIVLDILGVSETVDPEPLSFESLGEGQKQHNMGKIYSGLYETKGHIVPFMVVVKVGKPSEVSRPGNRGKRDSQMVIMRFLNRVHYNLPMSPLELEMHHQIRNIIGVNPTFYEYLYQIDADTVVAPDSCTRFVASFINDSKLIAICGETAITNAKASFITMIQVYEYWISHNMTKAFESLFGAVTCLPGCFTMYRIRAAESGKPLFISKDVVDAYANIRVDTLHMKNLLHLGEDRYLTTLLIKYHSKYKTKYTRHAKAWTIAPDSWKIFLSQRRRWINSTIHNLVELIPMQQLCGFCCFSMRFVVFLDLLSTVVLPVTVFYIVYMIVKCVLYPDTITWVSFLLIGVVYGLQAFIFIVRRKWEMVGWMIIYILALPVFSLGLPLYAFWHMDDFSWGNTRVIDGEKGRKVVVTDEGKFDPDEIPRKKWEEYQAELWEAQTTTRDDRSEISGISYGTRSMMHPGGMGHNPYGTSEYGRTTSDMDMPGSNPFGTRNGSRMSLAPSEMMHPASQGMEMGDFHSGPSDDQLLAEIRDILSTADLMTVTKKGIKQELERRFDMNLDSRKPYIGSATEAILSGQL